jgi:GxxExxY protein
MNDPVTYAVIGEAMAVHREVGPGVAEECYHQQLRARLMKAGIEHLSKPRRELLHRGVVADVFEPDVVLPAGRVLELKHLIGGFAAEHFVQLKAYLKFWQFPVGLLLDFGKESLIHQRYIYTDPPKLAPDVHDVLATLPVAPNTQPAAASVVHSLVRVVKEHGFGYPDTTYAGLLRADLTVEGVPCQAQSVATVSVDNTVLGQSRFDGLVVKDTLALLVIAQRNAVRPADRAMVQTWLRLLKLPLGLVAHFGKTILEIQWVLPTAHSSLA